MLPFQDVENARLEHERMTSLINSMTDGVIALDKDISVVLYNAAALNILDLNSSMQGRPLEDFFQPINRDKQPVDITALVKSTKTPLVDRDMRLKYRDGSIINLFLSISPVRSGYGTARTEGFVLMLRDITREKSLEEERDEFISVVSHELRTPIAISEGNISNAQIIAQKSGDMHAVQEALEQAYSQILYLSEMVNDLSTLSRAERGTLQVAVEEIDVKALVNGLVNAYKREAGKHGLTIEAHLENAPDTLLSSKLYTGEILQNYLTNALKYTMHGHIAISAETAKGGVLFKVQDSGIGISKSDQDRVFDKFFRSEDYRTRKTGGTGLGLYVTAKLARLLGGDIGLESTLDKGSTFSIFIPDLQPTASAAEIV